MKWYRKAADQGFAGAQYQIGLLYEKGRGVQQDIAQARTWYQKAAFVPSSRSCSLTHMPGSIQVPGTQCESN